jgi:hypothetical protein
MRRYAGEDAVHHCCLNVLNIVAMEEGVNILVDEDTCTVYWGDAGEAEFSLPDPVVKWAGIKGHNVPFDDPIILDRLRAVDYRVRHGECSLADCNDILRMNFHQIADVIDEHWEQM